MIYWKDTGQGVRGPEYSSWLCVQPAMYFWATAVNKYLVNKWIDSANICCMCTMFQALLYALGLEQ